MAIYEFLKKNAQATVAGNAGAGQSSEYVTADVLAQILYEMYGASQSGLVLPTGALGSFFPGGETLTGTNMMARTVDAASVSSAAASPTNLKSFTVPAAVPQILGLGTTAVPGVRGLWFYASGTTSNAANTKQITVSFGGSSQVSIVPIATTVISPWACWGTVLVRSNTSVVLSGQGGTCTSAGASFQGGGADLAVTGLTLTSALTLQFQGVSAAAGAGDTVQDTLIVGYIP
jgi:hypothetical protein